MSMFGRLAVSVTTLTVFGVVGCGDGDTGGGGGGAPAGGAPAAQQTGGGAGLSVPEWMTVNEGGKTMTLRIEAGSTADNNSWNFNGHYNGDATVVVPEGFAVTIEFKNNDPALAHSIGVDSRTGGFPPMFDTAEPLFPGAISSNPMSATDATRPGASETIEFTASTAGEYSLVCYVPAHALAGMWIGFTVSADGEAGVRM